MENVYYILIITTISLLAIVAFLGLYQKQLTSPNKSSAKEEKPEVIKNNTIEDIDEII